MITNKLKFYWDVLKKTFFDWNDSDATRNSASLAYYAVFSIPGLLIILIWISENFFGEIGFQQEMNQEIAQSLGTDAAENINQIVNSFLVNENANLFMKIVGIGALIFGATTLFFQLQQALNDIWDVEAAPKKAYIKFITDRASSLGLIIVIGFLIMITMILSSFISLANTYITKWFGYETYYLMQIINLVIGFLVVVILFALMFRTLPDLKISWKSVWSGAFFTAILFTIGKAGLSFYFSKFSPASAFGAASSIILIMLWINYTCRLILFGVSFTKIYSYKKGLPISLQSHSKWKLTKKSPEEYEQQTQK